MPNSYRKDHHNFFRTASFVPQTGTDDVSINWAAGNKYHLALDNDSTVTFATNPMNPCNLVLKVKQGNGGNNTITWVVDTGDLYWLDNTEPNLTDDDDFTDIITFYFDGTDYFGVPSFNFDTS